MVTWDSDSGDSLGVSAADSVLAYKKLADARPKNSMALNHDTLDGTARTIVPQVRSLSPSDESKFLPFFSRLRFRFSLD